MTTAIRVEHLGKRYRIDRAQVRTGYQTLRESVTRAALAPLRRWRHGAAAPREDFWALKDLSFDIKPGEVVGIIGRNGAGKSTLLKILSRITKPTQGQVTLTGRVGSLLEVGTGFHPELTGRDNIFLNGAILGMARSEIERKFAEIVAFAEIERFLDTPVKRYSSGMYVRLAFAVAAHLEPEILVIDEVLAVGDAAFQRKCLGVMGQVARGGRTVLFVSHNMAAIQQLTRRCVLLDQGAVAYDGPTSVALDRYAALSRQPAGSQSIEDLPRPDPRLRRQVEFVGLAMPGCTNHLVPADAVIPLDLTVRANGYAGRFRFSLTLFRLDGTPVGSLFSAEECVIAAGEVATFRLEIGGLHLAPGGYCFGPATGIGNPLEGHSDFDIVLDVLHFEMMAPEGPGGVRGTWPGAWGPIRLPIPQVTRMS